MRNSAVTKASILRAAEEEFSAKGLYGARVEEIANRAKSNKRMIYEYYGNKEELYKSVIESVYARLSEREMSVLQENNDCEAAVESIIRMYYDFLSNDRNFVNIIMWENLNQAHYMKQSPNLSGLKNPLITVLHKILEKGKAENKFRKDVDAEHLSIMLITLTFSYFSNIYTLSHLMKIDMTEESRMHEHMNVVKKMLIDYIKEDSEEAAV